MDGTIGDDRLGRQRFHKVAPEKNAKISGISAVAIALTAAGKLLAAELATRNLFAIKDAVPHPEWDNMLLPDAGQMLILHAAEMRYSRAALSPRIRSFSDRVRKSQ